MSDDNLIHLDGLRDIALRAAHAHQVDMETGLNYEKFGVCTPDLTAVAQRYVEQTIREAMENGLGLSQAMVMQFLAGFDIGYQTRIEVETRELVQGDPTQPYDQEQDG